MQSISQEVDFYFARISMENNDLIPIPEENVRLVWKGYRLELGFYPDVKLTRQDGFEFATTLSKTITIREVQVDDNEWRIFGGTNRDGLRVHIKHDHLSLDVGSPSNVLTNPLDWYEERYLQILNVFRDRFTPSVVLGHEVTIRALLPLTGPALPFLGGYVMTMNPNKLDAIDRPLHILGVRMYFPPYVEEESGTSTDWDADVRIETWHDDDKTLYIETAAEWRSPIKWDDSLSESAVSKLHEVSDFVMKRVLGFLRHPPFSIEGDDNGDD